MVIEVRPGTTWRRKRTGTLWDVLDLTQSRPDGRPCVHIRRSGGELSPPRRIAVLLLVAEYDPVETAEFGNVGGAVPA